jgi:hypothetical protein
MKQVLVANPVTASVDQFNSFTGELLDLIIEHDEYDVTLRNGEKHSVIFWQNDPLNRPDGRDVFLMRIPYNGGRAWYCNGVCTSDSQYDMMYFCR